MTYFPRSLGVFILKALGLYLVWLVVYEHWLYPAKTLDTLIIGNSLQLACFYLSTLGISAKVTGAQIAISGSAGIFVGSSCNGISLFALFTGFILSYPGFTRHGFWFIPTGILLLHGLNSIRIAALAYIAYKTPYLLEFNHAYTFTLLMYVIIMGMGYVWTIKWAKV